MSRTIELPLWLLLLILVFAAVTFASHFLFPSVRWFLRRRMERVVARLNQRLERPIQPFKLWRRADMIQRLIYDPHVMEAVADYAHENGVREDVAFEKARRYAREIVPSFSASAYFGFATRAAKWMSKLLYTVRVAGEQRLAGIHRDATVVFVMNHRSNMDYVLVTYVAAKSSALAYAVGEWANVWPLSALIKALGGYFIRRKSRTVLYRRILARYVQMATEAGVAQAVFPEGGLSLDGRLAPPKIGLLSYLTAGFDPAKRDIVFVPVAIGYDRVLEDKVLVAAGLSGERRFRGSYLDAFSFALRYLARRLTRRGYRMGLAGVVFGEPLSLRDLWERSETLDREALAGELMGRIGAVLPVLPVPLLAAVLGDGGSFTREELADEMAAAAGRLGAEGAEILLPEAGALDAGLSILQRRGLVTETDGRIAAAADRSALLTYYARSLRGGMDAPAAQPAGALAASEAAAETAKT